MRKTAVTGMVCIAVLAAVATAGLVTVNHPAADTAFAPVTTAAASAAQPYINQGKADLVAHNILGARDQFNLAVQADATNQEANLLYGVTRVFAVAEDGQGLNTAGLDSVREILELSGFAFSRFSIYGSSYSKPHQLASTTPRTGAVLDFLNTKLIPEVDGAIVNLSRVVNPGLTSVIDPSSIGKGSGVAITIDYADALVIRAFLQAIKCNLSLLMVYGLDASLPSIQTEPKQLMTYKQLFQDTTFLTPNNAAYLASAKSALVSFIDTYNTAAQYLKRRSGSAHHLFVVDVPVTDEATEVTSLELDKVNKELARLKTGLNGTYLLPMDRMRDQDRLVDLSKFFNSALPINLRSKLADCGAGAVAADPTVGGLFPLGLSAAVSPKLTAIAGDILGVACTGREKPLMKVKPSYIFLADNGSGSTGPQALTISNQGTANLVVSSSSLVGVNSTGFALTPGTCGTLTPSIAPGGSCTEMVNLQQPYLYTSPSAEVRIASNDVYSALKYVGLNGYTYVSGSSPPPTGTSGLTISRTGSGSGSVGYVGGGYSEWYPPATCPSACSGSYQTGAIFHLTPSPAPGSLFAGWSGCDYVKNDSCYVEMFAAKNVTAVFNLDPRPLTAKAFPPSGTYNGPQTVTLTADRSSTIHYTLDNSPPTASSTIYTGPITISQATTLKYLAIDPVGANSSTNTEAYTILPSAATLMVAPGGSGGGTINNTAPVSGLIICSLPSQLGDVCATTQTTGTVVILTATPDSTTSFAGWSLPGCTGTGPCSVQVNANTSVTGTFVTALPIQVVTTGYPTVYEALIQNAFADAQSGSVIMLQAVTFNEGNLVFGQAIPVTIKGGYLPGFGSQSGNSVLHGVLTIGAGSATIEWLTVK